ncbi:MAG: hypothetical protein VX100_07370 [Pseudomonadota bacterium]|nr:hypothetical protein [Pseudomonadota bacterium]
MIKRNYFYVIRIVENNISACGIKGYVSLFANPDSCIRSIKDEWASTFSIQPHEVLITAFNRI